MILEIPDMQNVKAAAAVARKRTQAALQAHPNEASTAATAAPATCEGGTAPIDGDAVIADANDAPAHKAARVGDGQPAPTANVAT